MTTTLDSASVKMASVDNNANIVYLDTLASHLLAVNVSLDLYYRGNLVRSGMVAEWPKVLIAVTYGVIHISLGYISYISSGLYPGCFMSSFHLYIPFHWTLWGVCMPLENPYNLICIYSIFGLQIIY